MDSVRGRAARRGIARLLAVCAVLFGLFLMHGAPATAAQGCHGAMADTAGLPMTLTAGTTHVVGMTHVAGGQDAAPEPEPMPTVRGLDAHAPVRAPGAHRPDPVVRAAEASGMRGALCVSTPAQERVPLPAPGLLAVAGAGALALWTAAGLRAADGGTRRGPPGGGRDLLLQVCVART